ncbi:hypothetical protein ACOMHN_060439 [Nucella lapillus]
MEGNYIIRRASSRRDVTLLAVVLCVMRNVQGAVANTVYFNSYGQCLRAQEGRAFSLQEGAYTVLATGAMEIHETLICHMTFKAPPDVGVCLTFEEFKVDDCKVSLDVYQGPSTSQRRWKKLTCDDENPPQMCTPERFVTLGLVKRKLNLNRGYAFRITVEKRSNFKGEDVILASSIGLFVGIIAGVVGVIVIIAAVVLCCCCRPGAARQLTQGKGRHGETHSAALQQVEPTAPPPPELEDEHTPLQTGPEGALYPALPLHLTPAPYTPTDQPPPYAPPPYDVHDFASKASRPECV